MRQEIKLSEIKFRSRMRKDLGDLTGLKDSIRRNGLHEPVILDEDNYLLAGERRYRCHEQLGMDTIYFVRREGLTEDQKEELEFEENFYRKSMSWQEEALGILSIYRKKKRRGALEDFSEYWQLTISEMFGMSIGTVNYILIVARKLELELKKPESDRRYWNFTSVAEAYRLGYVAEKEDEENQKLTQEHKARINSEAQQTAERELIKQVEEAKQNPDLLAEQRARYESNPLNTIPFDQYWSEKQAEASAFKDTIYLSNNLLHLDSISFMLDPENHGRFDHIITDPPYAIDMDNLNQSNQHGGLVQLERIVDAHQVEENRTLLARFLGAAWNCTKDHSFVILCCDPMLWQYLYDLATGVGFAVQRWPLIWEKVNQSVMNNCPSYNSTKDFEFAMVCRKPAAVVGEKKNTSIVRASNTEVVKLFGHPFSKPFELTKFFIELCSTEGQLILDPFCGGGSILVQMLRMNRRVIGVEKEEHHFNSMVENVKREFYLPQNPNFIFK